MPLGTILSKQAINTLTQLHAELVREDRLQPQEWRQASNADDAGLTARGMMVAILDGKDPQPSRKQELDVQAAILAALRKHQGKGVETVGTDRPVRWRLTAEDK
jgi:hypothetical protein